MKIKLLISVMTGLLITVSAQHSSNLSKGQIFKVKAGKDPFKAELRTNNNLQNVTKTSGQSYNVIYEIFLLPIEDAARILKQNLADADLYKAIIERSELESISYAKSMVDQRNKISGGVEFRYFDDYKPQHVLISGSKEAKNARYISGAPIPSSPYVQRLGLTIEFQVTKQKNDLLRLAVKIDDYQYEGDQFWGEGISKVALPHFKNQALLTAIVTKANNPYFLGTLPARVKSEVRDDKSSERLRIVIVTINKIGK